jgi:hypothetical protein
VRPARLALAFVLVAAASAAAVLAVDVRAWDDELAAADARFETRSARESWNVDERLPGSPAARLLDVDDDRHVREGLARFRAAASLLDDPLRRQEGEGARAAAARALAPVASGDGEAAAQANVLLGVLAFDQPEGPERAVAAFRNALRLDPANAAAKFDLELALRVLMPVGVRPGESGSGPRSGPARGAGAGEAGGGY